MTKQINTKREADKALQKKASRKNRTPPRFDKRAAIAQAKAQIKTSK